MSECLETGAVEQALRDIIEAYTDGDWQSFGRLIEQAAMALAESES